MIIWKFFNKQLKTHNMTKKILQLVVVLLIAAQGVMAQTSQIYDVTVDPGDISVQVDMLGYSDVGAITFIIEFDTDLMDFTGISDTQLTGSWIASYNVLTDRIVVTYTAPTGIVNPINGKAFDLDFSYKGGFSSDLTFDTNSCEVTTGNLQVVPTTYVDGSVAQTAAVGTISMDALIETPGTTINMPVDMTGGFASVASLTFVIAFDEFQMTYAGIVEDDLTGVVASATNGVLEITWSGTAVDLSAGHPFDIQFEYQGGDADVVFVAGCEINDNNLTPLAVAYTDGSVAAAAGTASLTIANVGSGTDTIPVPINVPIVAADFGTDVVGAITMVISYNTDLLEYTGYTAQQLSGWVVNSSTAGELTMEYSSATGSTLVDDNLVTLNFMYDTVGGQAEIEFEPGTFVKDVNLDIIPVSLYNGSVANHTVSGQLTYMGDATRVLGTSGTSATTVYLKFASDSTVAYTTTTDASGNYSFESVAAGSYFLDAMTTIDGSQSYTLADAYTVYAYAQTGNGLPTALQLLASDVNMDGSVTVTDAYMIYGSVNNSYIKPGTWLAAEWIFDNPPVVVSGDVTQNASAISSGDANADFIPVP